MSDGLSKWRDGSGKLLLALSPDSAQSCAHAHCTSAKPGAVVRARRTPSPARSTQGSSQTPRSALCIFKGGRWRSCIVISLNVELLYLLTCPQLSEARLTALQHQLPCPHQLVSVCAAACALRRHVMSDRTGTSAHLRAKAHPAHKAREWQECACALRGRCA